MAKAKTKTIVIRPLLVEARKKKGYTTQELADKAGLDKSFIFLLEHNKRLGTIPAWRKIQAALSLKDKDMWVIIHTTKRIVRKDL